MVLLWGERNACGGTVSLQHHQLWKIQQPVQLRWATARALSVKHKKKKNSVKVALGLEFTVTSSCWLTLRYNTTHTIEWLECLGFILGIILSHMCICTELVVVYLWHRVCRIIRAVHSCCRHAGAHVLCTGSDQGKPSLGSYWIWHLLLQVSPALFQTHTI